MATYFAPFHVWEGPDASGFYRVEDKNTFKVIACHREKEKAEEFARVLNLAYSHFVDAGGYINS